MLNFIFRFFSFQCCYTWIWPSRFYERWLSKVLNSRTMNKWRSKWSKHDTGVTIHYNTSEISKSPLFEGSALIFQKSRGGDQPSLILNCFRTPWYVQYTNVKENKLYIFLFERFISLFSHWHCVSSFWNFQNGMKFLQNFMFKDGIIT